MRRKCPKLLWSSSFEFAVRCEADSSGEFFWVSTYISRKCPLLPWMWIFLFDFSFLMRGFGHPTYENSVYAYLSTWFQWLEFRRVGLFVVIIMQQTTTWGFSRNGIGMKWSDCLTFTSVRWTWRIEIRNGKQTNFFFIKRATGSTSLYQWYYHYRSWYL